MYISNFIILMVFMFIFCYNEAVSVKDEKTFAAIREVHAHLDDDHDGNIDVTETADYLKTELESPDETRQTSFHNNDQQISVDDLWKKWKSSRVYKWTQNDVIDWLRNTVQLPEYEATFRLNKVDGKDIPRLATPAANLVQNELKITNKIHRKKIYLRASDVLLFGPPEPAKSLKASDVKNFAAIKAIHAHLDDDSDGDINIEESVEYMREELKEDSVKRHSSFHHNDELISVADLWNTWQRSEVYNWTNDQVITWLKYTVGLPQYENNFRQKNIDGSKIPRIAIDSSSYLQKELGVTNSKHRRKIYLRSSDLILFGIPEVRQSYFNDTLVLIVILSATLACLYAFRERKNTLKLVKNMSKDMESLQQAEQNLKQIQESLEERNENILDDEREQALLGEIEAAKKEATRLHTERDKNQEDKIKLSLVEQELAEVRLALAKAELEMTHNRFRSPKALQKWLQMTYKKEAQHFHSKKQRALLQMNEAKEACDKVSKTRRSVFGSLRLAHGQSIDDVDQKILDARSSLAEVTYDLQERQHRWRQIENVCNFSIVTDGLFTVPIVKTVERKSSINSYITDSLDTNSTDSFNATRKNYNNARENELTDSEVESITQQKCFKTSTVVDGPSSPENIISNVVVSCGSPIGGSPIRNKTFNENNRHSPIRFQTPPNANNSPILRTSSEKIVRNPEKRIKRTQTEPGGLSQLAFMNGKHRDGSTEQIGNKNRHSLDVDKNLPMSKSSEYIFSQSERRPRQESERTTNSDGEGDAAYLSDESTTSLASTATKKKRKGFSKLFRRSTKLTS